MGGVLSSSHLALLILISEKIISFQFIYIAMIIILLWVNIPSTFSDRIEL